MAVELKIRRLESGETLIAEFANLADAETWLRARPRNVDVLGTVGLEPPDADRLRAAMRPLDADEKTIVERFDAEAAAAVEAAMKREQAAAQEAIAARKEAAQNADPDRLLAVHWERGEGFSNADPIDPREVSEPARKAVLAWIAKRDTWVHPRGQYVVSADLMVWPGSIPGGGGEDERVEPGGQFNCLSGDPSDL